MNINDLENRIIAYLDEHRGEMIELLQNLVRINTVNPYCGDSSPRPGEENGQLFLQKELEKEGFTTNISPIPDDVFKDVNMIAPSGRHYSNRKNLQGRLSFGENGYTVILNGHMDTVGIDGMVIDPFSGEYKDGKIWGRGSSDDKSGLVGALMAVRALKEISPELFGTILFQSVADEECSGAGSGTLALCNKELKADMAIVVDGVGMDIETGSMGTMTYEIEIYGETAHASNGSGVSAFEKALFIKEAVDAFIKERKHMYPELNINIGVFQSGTIPSVIPGYAKMGINIDYSIEDARESLVETGAWGGELVRKRFEEMVMNKANEDTYLKSRPPVVVCVKDLYPFKSNRDGLIVRELKHAFSDVTEREPVVKTGMWCDAAHLSNRAGIQTVVFGPIARKKAHTADEFVNVGELLEFTKILSVALYRILKRKK